MMQYVLAKMLFATERLLTSALITTTTATATATATSSTDKSPLIINDNVNECVERTITETIRSKEERDHMLKDFLMSRWMLFLGKLGLQESSGIQCDDTVLFGVDTLSIVDSAEPTQHSVLCDQKMSEVRTFALESELIITNTSIICPIDSTDMSGCPCTTAVEMSGCPFQAAVGMVHTSFKERGPLTAEEGAALRKFFHDKSTLTH